jgi:hypothetical protein
MRLEANGGIQLMKDFGGDGETSDHTRLFRKEDTGRDGVTRNGRTGRDVAWAYVFLERAPHECAVGAGFGRLRHRV